MPACGTPHGGFFVAEAYPTWGEASPAGRRRGTFSLVAPFRSQGVNAASHRNIPLLRGGCVLVIRGGMPPPYLSRRCRGILPPLVKGGRRGCCVNYFRGFLIFACAAASRAMSSLIETPPSREGDAFFSFFGCSVGPLGACRNSNFLRITKITILVFAPNLRVKRFLSDETNKRTSALRRKRRFPHGNLFCGKGHPFRHSHCSCHPSYAGRTPRSVTVRAFRCAHSPQNAAHSTPC